MVGGTLSLLELEITARNEVEQQFVPRTEADVMQKKFNLEFGPRFDKLTRSRSPVERETTKWLNALAISGERKTDKMENRKKGRDGTLSIERQGSRCTHSTERF